MKKPYLRYLAVLLCVTALASCGGGDDGNAGGGGISVSADKARVDFAGVVGGTIYPQTVNFSLTGNLGSGAHYAQARLDRAGVVEVSGVSLPSARTASATLVPVAPTAAGQTSGTVTFLLCSDPACATVLWSQAMPYSVSAFSITPGNLALAGLPGTAIEDRKLTITPPDTNHLLEASVTSTDTPWLSVKRVDDSTLVLSAASQSLALGSYQARVTVAVAGSAPLTIPLALTQGSGILTPTDAAVQLQADTPTTTSGTLPIAFDRDAMADWTLRADQPWLKLSRTSGSGPDMVSYAVDMTAFGALANDASTVANVRISAPPYADRSIKVTVTKQMPEIQSMAPYAVATGIATTVRLNGRHLSRLAGNAGLMVDGQSAVNVTATSDTTALVALPALTGGSHTLTVANPLAQSPGLNFGAVGALPSNPLIARAGLKSNIAIDSLRQAIFVPNQTTNGLDRYQWNGSQWIVTALPITGIGRMAFALDRKILYVASGSQTLLAIDPDALTIKASYVSTGSLPYYGDLAGSSYGGHGLPITSNNRIWFTGSQWANLRYFDVATSTFATAQGLRYGTGSSSYPMPLYYGNLVASADGSRMAISQQGISPAQPSYLYATASDDFTQPANLIDFSYATLSPDGSMISVGNNLYALPAMTLIGTPVPTLPDYAPPSADAFSPRGTRLYVLSYGINPNSPLSSTRIPQFNVFDTTKLVNGTTALVMLGSIPINSTIVGSCSSIYSCPRPTVEIDPIGATLVIAGDQGVSTVAIPPQFRDPL
ncbi:hypothetical protein [Burkholderia sp. Ac-20379]|uniref:hypothetical protein n=1 Tax=Burkholderia sp. Ac-20379 TaxID=2703900 RepID=UPI001981C717|nr:hypothetical protein [Burkholderia sp. Ac-20379]MBN3725765.1 hypothetical protein [Burkholderia sp. Ac-20379]